MPVVTLGRTKCVLCGELLLNGEDIVALPPMFYNERDPAWVLNDAGVHRSCLAESGLSDRVMTKLRQVEEQRRRPKICVACGDVIVDPNDYFSTGPLGDGPGDPLEEFSWIEAHVSHLAEWEGTPDLVRTLEMVSRSAEWEGDILERLLERIDFAQKRRRTQ